MDDILQIFGTYLELDVVISSIINFQVRNVQINRYGCYVLLAVIQNMDLHKHLVLCTQKWQIVEETVGQLVPDGTR